MGSTLWPLQTFDPQVESVAIEQKLPHWSQPGCLCFITWRMIDSIPHSALNRWYGDRERWLRRHGIDPRNGSWKAQFLELDRSNQAEFVKIFSERWHRNVDSCHGMCPLRDPTLSQVVADNLHEFDGEDYLLTDFIVMPNHVHLLASFENEAQMLAQCDSWQRFTGQELNKRLGTNGRFWQQDGFDHLVHTTEQFDAFRRYIASNSERIRLKPTESVHFSKNLNSTS